MAVVDVRSDKDIGEFENTLTTGPITLILVYADWCGHCKTYKKDIWSNIVNWRKEQVENGIPMNQLASLHYDQLPKTSQRNVNLDGYPSVLVVGKDGNAATFPEGKNALPSQTARDMDALKTMLKTPEFSESATKLRNKVNTAVRSHTIEELKNPSPPESWKDVTKDKGKTRKMKTQGRTLLQSLMQNAKITGGAQHKGAQHKGAQHKGVKQHKRTRRSKSKKGRKSQR